MAANATCLCVVWPVLNYLSSLSKHPQVQVSSSILWVFLSYLLTKVRLIFARGYLKCHIQDSDCTWNKLDRPSLHVWEKKKKKMTYKTTCNYLYIIQDFYSKRTRSHWIHSFPACIHFCRIQSELHVS